jgi:glutamine synthetase
MSFKNGKEVIDFAKKNNVVMVDCRITDSPGLWQHCSHPISQLEESTFQDGYGFDGCRSAAGSDQRSDMLMIPDPRRVHRPVRGATLVLICDGRSARAALHPRSAPRREAAGRLKQSGSPTRYFREEFSCSTAPLAAGEHGYYGSTPTKLWNAVAARSEPRFTRSAEGYFRFRRTQQDIRTEMCLEMQKMGIVIETQHHEVATAGRPRSTKFDTLV